MLLILCLIASALAMECPPMTLTLFDVTIRESDDSKCLSFRRTAKVGARVDNSSKIDVMFFFDTSGSMGAVLASAQTNAISILTSAAALGDVQFAVSQYKDFPVSPFGGSSDFPFMLNQDVTSSTSAVQTAINSLSASGGLDQPESQLYGLVQVTNQTSWRAGADRIVVWFGDAYGHDGALDPGYPSPLTKADTISILVAANIKVMAVSTAGTLVLDGGGRNQGTDISSATGGLHLLLANAANIVSVIADALNAAVISYMSVSLQSQDAPCVQSFISPPSYTGSFNRSVDRFFTFNHTVCCNCSGKASLMTTLLLGASEECAVTDKVECIGFSGGNGDPHFVTADGLRYLFNGVGTYTYMLSDDDLFEIQVHTHLVGNNTSAFGALGIRYKRDVIRAFWDGYNTESLGVGLNEKSYGYNVTRITDNDVFTLRQSTDQEDSKSVVIQLQELDVAVTLSYVGRSSFLVSIPALLHGKIRGLAGNANGDPTDDLQTPSGVVVPVSADARTIHYDFAQKWAVPQSSERSMFASIENDCPALYEPEFGINMDRHGHEFKQQVYELCAGSWACQYDAAATGSLRYAGYTKQDMGFMERRKHVIVDSGRF